MHCKNCGVEIAFDTKVCPICHSKLYNKDEQLPSFFPEKQALKPVKNTLKLSFSSIYITCSLILSIIGIILNFTLLPNIKWVFLLMGILIYVYLLIHNTILSANTVGLKVFVQLIMLLAIFWLSEIIVKDVHPETSSFWILDIGLPVLLIFSMIAVSISTIFVYKQKKALLFDIIWISLLGYIPLILFACNIVTNPIASYVCSTLASIIIITTSILARTALKDELMRHFHI